MKKSPILTDLESTILELTTKAHELEMDSINSFFEYIIESEINGNRSQVVEMIKGLSKDAKKLFYQYIDRELPSGDHDVLIVKNLIIELL